MGSSTVESKRKTESFFVAGFGIPGTEVEIR